jgi:tRNA A-37 threonylcarbamoyl transferase component Bud32
MGIVYRARDVELQRDLAMKVLRRSRAMDARSVARFLEEAQVAAQLDHPGIVPVHEVGLGTDGQLYFTMKLVRGRTLEAIVDMQRAGQDDWTLPRVMGVLVRVCEAMAFAHEKGVVHRDLKPGNVMVGPFGEVYVTDWGLAKIVGRPDRTGELKSLRHAIQRETPGSPLLTGAGEVVGTPAYMAPEQALGAADALAPSADIYSMGAILYHALAGAPPYETTGDDHAGVWRRVQEGPPVALQAGPAAPEELVAICERAMARDLARRYPTMQELRQDLTAWIEGRVVGAFERGAWAQIRKWVRRNKLVATLTVAMLLAIPTLAALLAFGLAQRTKAHIESERAYLLRLRQDLAVAREEAATLYPAWPRQENALQRWLAERGAPLLAALPRVEAALSQGAAGEQNDLARFFEATARETQIALREFADPERGLYADVERRLAWAECIERRGIEEHRARWDEARSAIARADGVVASKQYGVIPIDLEPQLDLVPIGMNPATKLWEFLHLPTCGEPLTLPQHVTTSWWPRCPSREHGSAATSRPIARSLPGAGPGSPASPGSSRTGAWLSSSRATCTSAGRAARRSDCRRTRSPSGRSSRIAGTTSRATRRSAPRSSSNGIEEPGFCGRSGRVVRLNRPGSPRTSR